MPAFARTSAPGTTSIATLEAELRDVLDVVKTLYAQYSELQVCYKAVCEECRAKDTMLDSYSKIDQLLASHLARMQDNSLVESELVATVAAYEELCRPRDRAQMALQVALSMGKQTLSQHQTASRCDLAVLDDEIGQFFGSSAIDKTPSSLNTSGNIYSHANVSPPTSSVQAVDPVSIKDSASSGSVQARAQNIQFVSPGSANEPVTAIAAAGGGKSPRRSLLGASKNPGRPFLLSKSGRFVFKQQKGDKGQKRAVTQSANATADASLASNGEIGDLVHSAPHSPVERPVAAQGASAKASQRRSPGAPLSPTIAVLDENNNLSASSPTVSSAPVAADSNPSASTSTIEQQKSVRRDNNGGAQSPRSARANSLGRRNGAVTSAGPLDVGNEASPRSLVKRNTSDGRVRRSGTSDRRRGKRRERLTASSRGGKRPQLSRRPSQFVLDDMARRSDSASSLTGNKSSTTNTPSKSSVLASGVSPARTSSTLSASTVDDAAAANEVDTTNADVANIPQGSTSSDSVVAEEVKITAAEAAAFNPLQLLMRRQSREVEVMKRRNRQPRDVTGSKASDSSESGNDGGGGGGIDENASRTDPIPRRAESVRGLGKSAEQSKIAAGARRNSSLRKVRGESASDGTAELPAATGHFADRSPGLSVQVRPRSKSVSTRNTAKRRSAERKGNGPRFMGNVIQRDVIKRDAAHRGRLNRRGGGGGGGGLNKSTLEKADRRTSLKLAPAPAMGDPAARSPRRSQTVRGGLLASPTVTSADAAPVPVATPTLSATEVPVAFPLESLSVSSLLSASTPTSPTSPTSPQAGSAAIPRSGSVSNMASLSASQLSSDGAESPVGIGSVGKVTFIRKGASGTSKRRSNVRVFQSSPTAAAASIGDSEFLHSPRVNRRGKVVPSGGAGSSDTHALSRFLESMSASYRQQLKKLGGVLEALEADIETLHDDTLAADGGSGGGGNDSGGDVSSDGGAIGKGSKRVKRVKWRSSASSGLRRWNRSESIDAVAKRTPAAAGGSTRRGGGGAAVGSASATGRRLIAYVTDDNSLFAALEPADVARYGGALLLLLGLFVWQAYLFFTM